MPLMQHLVHRTLTASRAGINAALEAYHRILSTPSVPASQARQTRQWEQFGTTLDPRGDRTSPLLPALTRPVYDSCVQTLPNGKSAGPDKIPYEVIKHLPPELHTMLFTFFKLCWAAAIVPDTLLHSDTALFLKREPSHLPGNYRPIGTHRTLYKLYTRIVTHVLSAYTEEAGIFTHSQEGFRPGRSTDSPLQCLTLCLEDAKHYGKDIYVATLDYCDAYNSVGHSWLLEVMWKLGYPRDAIAVIGSLYSAATTAVHSPAGTTSTIPVARGVVQGDGLSPLLFSIAIEPLLRLLESDCPSAADPADRGYAGYHPGCIKAYDSAVHPTPPHHSAIAALAYADDLQLLSGRLSDMQRLLSRVQAFSTWSGMQLAPHKCKASAVLYGSAPPDFKPASRTAVTHILAGQLTLDGQPLTVVPPTEAQKYLGIHISLTLNWAAHAEAITQKLKDKADAIYKSRLSGRQQLMMDTDCILHSLRHSFCVAPLTARQLTRLDSIRARLYKYTLGMPATAPHAAIYASPNVGGMGAVSLMQEYVQVCAETQVTSLSHPGRLGTLARAFMHTLQSPINAGTVADR